MHRSLGPRRCARVLPCLLAVAACGNSPKSSTYDFGPPDAGHDATTSRLPKVMSLGGGTDSAAGCGELGLTTGTVKGTVYDPAGRDPIYNVAVYVPTGPLAALPRGVPTGKDACACGSLYPTAAYASTSTTVDGTFVLEGVPIGTQDLVLQIGKWRRRLPIHVACAENTIRDRTLTLPGTVAAGDTDDNMPDIAVSTGAADTLECLLRRMGVSPVEYVAGPDMAGHVHIFAGGNGPLALLLQADGGAGAAEVPAFPGAPASSQALWAETAQLMPFDIVLLSCEGFETYRANPPALEAYLNAGGRAFASHFHYSWFSGPLASGQSYAAPSDWGGNLGTWQDGAFRVNSGGEAFTDAGAPVNLTLVGGAVEPTLNDGSGTPFSKGATMQTWLREVGALGKGGVPVAELSIYSPRYNVTVGPNNVHSQPWLTADFGAESQSGAAMYFSFNTPLDALSSDGGTGYCGRAVYSDLHVGGDPSTTDVSPPPGGCDVTELSPQEKALEFMLFDLSSCVTDDALPVPDAGTVVIPVPH